MTDISSHLKCKMDFSEDQGCFILLLMVLHFHTIIFINKVQLLKKNGGLSLGISYPFRARTKLSHVEWFPHLFEAAHIHTSDHTSFWAPSYMSKLFRILSWSQTFCTVMLSHWKLLQWTGVKVRSYLATSVATAPPVPKVWIQPIRFSDMKTKPL